MKIKLYIVEEQEFLRDAYNAVLPLEPTLDVVGISGNTNTDGVMSVLSAFQPDVMILGTKMLQSSTIIQLETIQEHFPDLGIVLLSTLFDIKGIKQLKEYTNNISKGSAFLLKRSIDKTSQLTQIVHAVVEGQIVLDPVIMENLICVGESKTTFLQELTHRELEVLNWMANGYRNNTIADVLGVDQNTLQIKKKKIYSKLDMQSNSKHPRVSSIMLYLKATGQLLNYDLLGM